LKSARRTFRFSQTGWQTRFIPEFRFREIYLISTGETHPKQIILFKLKITLQIEGFVS